MQIPQPPSPPSPPPSPFPDLIYTPGPAQDPSGLPAGFPGELLILIPVVFIIFVLAPIAIAAARLMWKRASVSPVRSSGDSDQRLARLEQAMDSVAVEVERISESQRFMTRLLTEGTAVTLQGQRTAEGTGARREETKVPRE